MRSSKCWRRRGFEMSAPRLSVIIPVYNEQETLPTLFARLLPSAGTRWGCPMSAIRQRR